MITTGELQVWLLDQERRVRWAYHTKPEIRKRTLNRLRARAERRSRMRFHARAKGQTSS